MPSFDLRFIRVPEDLPGSLISVDSLDATIVDGDVTEILNRAPPSLRRFQDGDTIRTKWWNALAQFSGSPPSHDDAAFDGSGGIVVPAGANFLLTSMLSFPLTPAGEYTLVFVVDGTFTGATQKIVFSDAAGLAVKINNGSGNLSWSDAGGGGTGPATVDGKQLHVVRFGKVDPLASPTVNWRLNGALIAASAYTPTNFGGGATTIFGGASGFGTVGRFMFFNRRLTDTEVLWLESFLNQDFTMPYGGAERFVGPSVVDWLDPPDSRPTRLNPEPGHHTERAWRVSRGHSNVSVLAVAVENAGAGNEPVISTASGYQPRYVEWPFGGPPEAPNPDAPEPPVFQDAVLPGVCKLPIAANGHYLFELYRPTAGAILLPFDAVIT